MNFQIIPVAEASVKTLIQSINTVIVNPLIIFLFALAVVYFIYGLAKYLLNPNNDTIRKEAKSSMLWGVIGIFIMISVFSIMNLVLNTLGVSEDDINIETTGEYEIGDFDE